MPSCATCLFFRFKLKLFLRHFFRFFSWRQKKTGRYKFLCQPDIRDFGRNFLLLLLPYKSFLFFRIQIERKIMTGLRFKPEPFWSRNDGTFFPFILHQFMGLVLDECMKTKKLMQLWGLKTYWWVWLIFFRCGQWQYCEHSWDSHVHKKIKHALPKALCFNYT